MDMEERELRIGNWLYEFNTPFRVDYINEARPMYDVSPIHLTEQWLIDFGFVHFLKGLWSRKSVELYWDVDNCGRFVHFWANKFIEVNHVHQLQNLYFELTGKELTIKK